MANTPMLGFGCSESWNVNLRKIWVFEKSVFYYTHAFTPVTSPATRESEPQLKRLSHGNPKRQPLPFWLLYGSVFQAHVGSHLSKYIQAPELYLNHILDLIYSCKFIPGDLNVKLVSTSIVSWEILLRHYLHISLFFINISDVIPMQSSANIMLAMQTVVLTK